MCLVLEGTYPASLGGISTWVEQLLFGLPRSRFSIARIGRLPAPAQWAHTPPANVVAVHSVNEPGDYSLAEIEKWAERQALELPSADVYHAVGAGLATALAHKAAEAHRGRFLLSEHSSYVQELERGSTQLETGMSVADAQVSHGNLIDVFREIGRRGYRGADAVTALSERHRSHQLALGAASQFSFVIPNGVDAAQNEDSVVTENRFLVAAVGRINPLKGTDRFLRVVRSAAPHVAHLRAHVVGPADCGPCFVQECEEIAAQCGDTVQWLGARARGDWGPRPDLLVLPSRSEAQPLVVLEAMSRGIPVLAMDVGDCREMLAVDSNRRCGSVVRDEEYFVQELIRLSRAPETLKRWGRRGVERARTVYPIGRMVSGYKQLYRELGVQQCA
ncbi:MAG: GT4 family glycosyltransferase PelF [Myxococcota bacterium]